MRKKIKKCLYTTLHELRIVPADPEHVGVVHVSVLIVTNTWICYQLRGNANSRGPDIHVLREKEKKKTLVICWRGRSLGGV